MNTFRNPTTNTSASAMITQAMSKSIASATCSPQPPRYVKSFPIIPNPPMNLQVSVGSVSGSVFLQWTPPINDGRSPIIYYTITFSQS